MPHSTPRTRLDAAQVRGVPDAKKPFNLKAVHQPELDVHGIASKAAVYNIETSPKVIEEGLNAGMELIYYLAADGFKIKTPLNNSAHEGVPETNLARRSTNKLYRCQKMREGFSLSSVRRCST